MIPIEGRDIERLKLQFYLATQKVQSKPFISRKALWVRNSNQLCKQDKSHTWKV